MKKKKSPGRPNKLKKELKKSTSIRITDNKKTDLTNRYGSFQKAIDYFITEDDKLWQ